MTRPGAQRSWKVADLIDLEVLLRDDEKGLERDADHVRERDRGLYLDLAQRASSDQLRQRRWLFREWLERRRRERFGPDQSPGKEVESLLAWVQVGLGVAGFLAARAAVWSFFRGAEMTAVRPEPINVFWYGLVCIGIPLALTLYGFWIALSVRTLPASIRPPVFVRGLLGLLRPWVRRIASHVSEGLGPERRLSGQALWGAVKQRMTNRREALAAQVLCLVQTLGLMFTAGVLVFSWLDCQFHSRVFGWQTTDRETTPEAVHEIVRVVAAPWAWLAPEGAGFPTLEQVRRTQFIRFRDPERFPPEAAGAWAAFLIAAALVYGFLPRVALYLLSRHRMRQALRLEQFEALRFDPLWERLTRGRAEWGRPAGDSPTASATTGGETPEGDHLTGPASCVLLLPVDLDTAERLNAIGNWLQERKGWQVKQTIILGAEPAAMRKAVAQIDTFREQGAPLRLVLVQESFMPPVKEILRSLQDIRSSIAPGSGLIVGLLGKPGTDVFGLPPKALDVEVWRKKVQSLGDPNLDVLTFLEPAA